MIIQSIKMAIEEISSNRVRTFLTMLGILIGVVAVCLIMTLTDSITLMIKNEFGNLGDNFCQANIFTDANKLTLYNIEEMKEQNSSIYKACAFNATLCTVERGTFSDSTMSIGAVSSSDFAQICDMRLEYGRQINSFDIEKGSYVTILSYNRAQEIFGDAQKAIGQHVMANGYRLKVVGVMRRANLTADTFGDLLIPYSLYMDMFPNEYISSVLAMAPDSSQLAECKVQLEHYLDSHYNSTEKVYSLADLSGDMATFSLVSFGLTLLLVGITAVCLVVGGIGIMNIMLVSVTERTREIGIRKAIGASKKDIMLQFLLESVIISVLGALVGLLLSFVLVPAMKAVAEQFVGVSLTMKLESGTVVLAVAFALFVGIIFGISPANKAAKLRPIEALRHE